MESSVLHSEIPLWSRLTSLPGGLESPQLTDFNRGLKQSAKCVLQKLSAFFDEEHSFENSTFL
jgi:hypothetical protein